jgi:uncharacterized protein YjiS (DUF1127 family)
MSDWILNGAASPLVGDSRLRNRKQGLAEAVSIAWRAMITRRGLMDLDDRALEDIGLTRGEARAEARRVPWDVQPAQRPQRRPDQPKPAPFAPVGSWMKEAARRYRSRRFITALDGAMLKDMGASYSDAENEANKPFWRS